MPAESILNRKALRDFHILERYEAGVALKGSEVKSIRAGKANISDAFARIENGEAFLYGADIQPYAQASHDVPAAKRVRKLLLHQREIDQLYGLTNIKGRALVVLKLYWKNGRIKAELGVATGKDAEAALGKAHITVNKNAVPNDPQKPFVTSGLRVGTPAVTTRGYLEADCVELANWICDVLDAPADEAVIANVRAKVEAQCKKFPVYG